MSFAEALQVARGKVKRAVGKCNIHTHPQDFHGFSSRCGQSPIAGVPVRGKLWCEWNVRTPYRLRGARGAARRPRCRGLRACVGDGDVDGSRGKRWRRARRTASPSSPAGSVDRRLLAMLERCPCVPRSPRPSPSGFPSSSGGSTPRPRPRRRALGHRGFAHRDRGHGGAARRRYFASSRWPNGTPRSMAAVRAVSPDAGAHHAFVAAPWKRRATTRAC